jgi:hypothetical protein
MNDQRAFTEGFVLGLQMSKRLNSESRDDAIRRFTKALGKPYELAEQIGEAEYNSWIVEMELSSWMVQPVRNEK